MVHPVQMLSAYAAIPPPRGIALTVLPAHDCSYLPGRSARMRAFMCDALDPEIYHDLMDAGFRRSGRMIYQPVCAGCRECRAIRVPVERFAPSKSQRRAWRRNQDLIVTVAPPQPTQEKFHLYADYMAQWHRRPDEADPQSFVSFLYDSPVQSLEFSYRDASGRQVGVGICDVCARSLSSVYFYFAPSQAARRLGTFSTLWELDFARRRRLPWYYLGYWIKECAAMKYKSSFRPHEILRPDGVWQENSADACG